ncbi:MAG: ABC transporter permease [Chryseolinea sp.]
MLLNYLKLALRLMARKPFFTFINIAGLSVAFASFLVLWQYSSSELSCDRHHTDHDNIARLIIRIESQDEFGRAVQTTNGQISPEFAKIFHSESPAISSFTRIYPQSSFNEKITIDHNKDIFLSNPNDGGTPVAFKEEHLAYADRNLFEFFTIPLIEGNAGTVLTQPNSIVLSESMARKYFGTTDIINEPLLLNNTLPLKVTGVFEDLPQSTHLSFTAVMSTERIIRRFDATTNPDDRANVYFKINAGTDRELLTASVTASFKTFVMPVIGNIDVSLYKIYLSLQPLDEICFSKLFGDEHMKRSKILLHGLQVLSFIILFMAWINYVNLVIYANNKRMKEWGIRRTSGARSFDFAFQFLTESSIVNFFGVCGALTLVQLCRAPLLHLLHINLTNQLTVTALSIVIIAALTGALITGLYPAVSVMRQTTSRIFHLKNVHKRYLPGGWLTVFQFASSIVLIIGVFVMYNQINFMLKKDLGIKKDNVIVFDLPSRYVGNMQSTVTTFTNQLSSLSHVTGVALSGSVPGDGANNNMCIQRSKGSKFSVVETNGGVDEKFVPFFNLKLIAGRNFVNDDPINKRAIIVSRKALKQIGLGEPADEIGREVLVEKTAWTHNMSPAVIIGVVEDFQRYPLVITESTNLGADEAGFALTYWDNLDDENIPQKVSVTLQPDEFQDGMQEMKRLYKDAFPNNFFNWYFLENNVNQHYVYDEYNRNQFLVFTFVAILIACLGLLGMVSNTAEEKRKEIGIRKVLGAELNQVTQLLLSSSVKQTLIASMIAVPLSYFLSQSYLLKFQERIELNWWHYAIPVVILASIMLSTVASVVWHAVRENPVDALKHE